MGNKHKYYKSNRQFREEEHPRKLASSQNNCNNTSIYPRRGLLHSTVTSFVSGNWEAHHQRGGLISGVVGIVGETITSKTHKSYKRDKNFGRYPNERDHDHSASNGYSNKRGNKDDYDLRNVDQRSTDQKGIDKFWPSGLDCQNANMRQLKVKLGHWDDNYTRFLPSPTHLPHFSQEYQELSVPREGTSNDLLGLDGAAPPPAYNDVDRPITKGKQETQLY